MSVPNPCRTVSLTRRQFIGAAAATGVAAAAGAFPAPAIAQGRAPYALPREPPVMRTVFIGQPQWGAAALGGARSRRSPRRRRGRRRSTEIVPCHLRLFLVLLLQRGHDGRIGERGHVAEGAAFGDVAEEAAHDLAGAGLRQVDGDEDLLRPGDGADLLGDVRLQLLLELRRIRAAPRRAATP